MTEEEFINLSEEQQIAYLKTLNPYIDIEQMVHDDEIPLQEYPISLIKNCVVLIKSGDANGNYGYAHKEFMIIHPDLLKYIIRDGLAPGSIVYTANLANMYQLGPDIFWYEIGGNKVGGDDQNLGR